MHLTNSLCHIAFQGVNIQEVKPYFVVEPGIFSDIVNSFNVEVVKRKNHLLLTLVYLSNTLYN